MTIADALRSTKYSPLPGMRPWLVGSCALAAPNKKRRTVYHVVAAAVGVTRVDRPLLFSVAFAWRHLGCMMIIGWWFRVLAYFFLIDRLGHLLFNYRCHDFSSLVIYIVFYLCPWKIRCILVNVSNNWSIYTVKILIFMPLKKYSIKYLMTNLMTYLIS